MQCVLFNFFFARTKQEMRNQIYIYIYYMFLNWFSTYMYVMQTLPKVGPAVESTMYK